MVEDMVEACVRGKQYAKHVGPQFDHFQLSFPPY